MFTITVRCLTHDTEVEDVSWYPTDHGEFGFEFDNCPKGQIVREVGGCQVKVVLFQDDKYTDDGIEAAHKIAEFDSREFE